MRRDFSWQMAVLAAGALGVGCGEAGGEGDGVIALFELPRGGATSEFYALPFPNDLRRDADGTIQLAGHARPNALLGDYLDVFETLDGFGVSSAAFFRFSAPINPASLPATPEASREADASVYLVDVDPDSPTRGTRTPLKLRFEPRAGEGIGENWLSVLPYPGFPLRGATTYAAVVTRRVTAPDGSAVGRSTDWSAVVGEGSGGPMDGDEDAEVERARRVYAPLLAWLDEPGGDGRDDVAAAAVFTTMDPTALIGRARAVLYRDRAAPVARDVVMHSTQAGYVLWTGVYDGPTFQTGTVPYAVPPAGAIELDAAGDPVLQGDVPIRFAVSIPTGRTRPATGWPVVLYAHGTGGDYLSFHRDGTARRLAGEGLAVLSIDQIMNGARNPNGSPELDFFNFQNPVAALNNARQAAIDNFTLVRLIGTLRIGDETFDPENVAYFGHSQGGITGPPFLAWEPGVRGAVLSGAGGLIYLSLLLKTQPIDIPSIVSAVIRDQPLDEFNNFLALVQAFIDAADPVSYGRMLVDEPPPGVGPKHIYQSEGLTDTYTPLPSIEALGVALGLQPARPVLADVPGFALRRLSPLDAPIAGNLSGTTGVFVQYRAASGDDGHLVVFDVPEAQRQHAAFLGTLAREGVGTLVP